MRNRSPLPVPVVTGRSAGRHLVTAVLALSAVTTSVLVTTPAPTASAQDVITRFRKPAHAVLGEFEYRDRIHVKFAPGTEVRLRDGALISLSGSDISAVTRTVTEAGATVAPLFKMSEADVDELTDRAATRSGEARIDLNQWYELGITNDDPVPLIDALNALPQVETAFAKHRHVPAGLEPGDALEDLDKGLVGDSGGFRDPVASPDLTAKQTYRTAAQGIDVDGVRSVPGATGKHVKVHDVEFGWNGAHEDLSKLRDPDSYVKMGTPKESYIAHGTSVMGEMISDANGFGVTGIVPDAKARRTNAFSVEHKEQVSTAVAIAAKSLSPGDVLIIELQDTGPKDCGPHSPNYVPSEWDDGVYDATKVAVQAGIIVIAPAGNGFQDLDHKCYGGAAFPKGKGDSGAIMVGSAHAGPPCGKLLTKRPTSDFGVRVNLQGIGECVVTTGGGDLHNGGANANYTKIFNGTSSAGPVVAGAAAALSSVAREKGHTLTPAQVRSILVETGTAQINATQRIGPLPNLKAALARLHTILDAG